MPIDFEKKTESIKRGLKKAEKLQFAGLIFVSLILLTGVDLITAQIGWSSITDPYFYISNLITDAALLLITFATVHLVLDSLKEKDDTYLNAKKELDEFAVSKENIPSVLSRFLDDLNRKRKLNQYEHNILIKLYKLDNQRKWYAYLPIVKWFVRNPNYYTEEEIHIWNFGTEEEKAKSRYCRKRKMYEEQLDKEFIEKNIDITYIKYDKITSSVLLNDYYRKSVNLQINEFITKDETSQIMIYRMPFLVLTFGFTFLVTSLVLDSVRLNWIALITISSKLFLILYNVFTSYRYAKKHFANITLHDALFRRSIVQEYYKWLIQEAEKQEQTKNSNKENNEKIVEHEFIMVDLKEE